MPYITVEIIVKGLVQGVGFRPFVFRLAKKHDLTGFVSNREFGVFIKVRGKKKEIELFLKELKKDAPSLSKISSINIRPAESKELFNKFIILESKKSCQVSTLVSPDISICKECYSEILNKHERRFEYAFTNCTNCGPRYTIIEKLPYDRANTSMKGFKMCNSCKNEFENPLDRRFHAQPIACPACGPQLNLFNGKRYCHENVLKKAAIALKDGKILAIKGLGGFHLACNAYDSNAINSLRERKKRPFKPFAIMVKDIEVAKKLCILTKDAIETLKSQYAPIVISPKKEEAKLPHLISPNITDIGVMLPYTPLHALIFQQTDCPDALIMTSGNQKDEPLCFKNEHAIKKLSDFCDIFILHNRPIVTGIDDSVLRQTNIGNIFLRRARGYVPEPIELPFKLKQLLCVGAEMKNTFCLTKDNNVYVSQYIGELTNEPVFKFFRKNIKHLCKLFEIEPEIVGMDLHPDYLSSRFASELGLPTIKIQHHFAHAASVIAEHNLKTPVIGIILDGTGLGTDGTIWGGEILIAGHAKFKRVAKLKPFPLPGGDFCAKEPWRTNISTSIFAGIDKSVIKKKLPPNYVNNVDFIIEMIKKEVNSPFCSSCGRLFDAASSILGICHKNTHEAQAAMELEAKCTSFLKGADIKETNLFNFFSRNKSKFLKRSRDVEIEIDWSKAIKVIYESKNQGEKAAFFHAFLTWAFSEAAIILGQKYQIKNIVLSGGCFQNRVLIESVYNYLTEKGFKPYVNLKVPPNDGGISLGQAYIANKLKEMV